MGFKRPPPPPDTLNDLLSKLSPKLQNSYVSCQTTYAKRFGLPTCSYFIIYISLNCIFY